MICSFPIHFSWDTWEPFKIPDIQATVYCYKRNLQICINASIALAKLNHPIPQSHKCRTVCASTSSLFGIHHTRASLRACVRTYASVCSTRSNYCLLSNLYRLAVATAMYWYKSRVTAAQWRLRSVLDSQVWPVITGHSADTQDTIYFRRTSKTSDHEYVRYSGQFSLKHIHVWTVPSRHTTSKWRRINVDATWSRRIDVDTTSF